MSPIPPSLITPTLPTEAQTATPAPVSASPTTTSPSTTPSTAPSTPVDSPRSETATTVPLLKTATTTDTNPNPSNAPAPTPAMGHKTRKGVLYTTAILLPPLAIYFQHGTHRKHFGLNVLLTLLGWIPGVLHALYHVSK